MKENKWCEKCLKKGKKRKTYGFLYHENRRESLCIDCYRSDEKNTNTIVNNKEVII